jgi:hypothetical protein
MCHKFLMFTKAKESRTNMTVAEHKTLHMRLMTTENQLQKQGKSNFVFVSSGVEASLLLEVVGGIMPVITPDKPLHEHNQRERVAESKRGDTASKPSSRSYKRKSILIEASQMS